MKLTTRILIAVAALMLALPAAVKAANVEPVGVITLGVGAERETGASSGCANIYAAQAYFTATGGIYRPSECVGQAGVRGTASVLGVLPFSMMDLGLQFGGNYIGGDGSRFGAKVGPIYGWTGGKVGAIVDYQYRSHGQSHFFWITPAVNLYFGNLGVNLSYTQPMSSVQKKETVIPNTSEPDEVDNRWITRYVPTNRIQGTVSYFVTNFLELTAGLQVNTFAGNTKNIGNAGVGPVAGIAWMPIQNIELFAKGTVDNRSRFNVLTGIGWAFAGGGNLKDVRRKSLVTPEPQVGITGPYSGQPFFTP